MPRVHNQARFDLLLPSDVLDQVREIALEEETAIAEVVRRVGDLIITFDVPSVDAPIPPVFAGATTERFTYYIPNPQLAKLTLAADTRGVTIHELIRQGLILYALRKEKAKRFQNARVINPTIPRTRHLEHAEV